GVYLERATGNRVDDLIAEISKDRFRLARKFLRQAKFLSKTKPTRYRVTIARSYYAMYHAARAVVYFHHGGDDFQEHSVLPKHLPGDFPDRAKWDNELKTARLERNRADYDAYPRRENSFKAVQIKVLKSAELFFKVSQLYLVTKGCRP